MTRRRLFFTALGYVACLVAVVILTPLAMVSRDADRLAGHKEWN